LASLPSINRVEPLDGDYFYFSEEPYFKISLCFAGSPSFFFLHQMVERKGEDEGERNGGRALAMQESDLCSTLVVMMNCYNTLVVMTGCHRQG